MAQETTLVHVTHEAAEKVGGIGAVLAGFFTSKSYLEAVDRSIIIGPLFTKNGNSDGRLGNDGKVLYSSFDGIYGTPYDAQFGRIERQCNVDIIYGKRTFTDSQSHISSDPEVFLIDVSKIAVGPLNHLKREIMYFPFTKPDIIHDIFCCISESS